MGNDGQSEFVSGMLKQVNIRYPALMGSCSLVKYSKCVPRSLPVGYSSRTVAWANAEWVNAKKAMTFRQPQTM